MPFDKRSSSRSSLLHGFELRQVRTVYFVVLMFITVLAVVSYSVIRQARSMTAVNVQQIAELEAIAEILLFVAFGMLIFAALTTFRLLERRLLEREAELGTAVRQQQTLFQERLRMATIVESLNDAVIGKTLDGIITTWNPAAERLYGYQPQEAIGKPISMLIPQGQPDEVLVILNKIRQGERIERYETQRKRKDGQVITVSLTISPIYDENGTTVGAATIAHDVTQRKELEERAFRLAVEQENVRIMTDFIRDTSHEFRTPLTILQTAAYLLSRTSDPAKRQARIDSIQEQIQHLSKLIDQFQLMVLLESSSHPALTLVKANDIVEAICETFANRATEKQLDIRLELQPDLPSIAGDMHQLHIALAGLLENAILYTPEGGHIGLGTSQKDGYIHITVSDSGIGISPEDLPHIFERFYKADKARPMNQSGTGLGLTMVKAVVEAHHGSIQVKSIPGQGSVFTIELPLKP